MQLLKPGQLANIKCESLKKTTLMTWVEEDVVVGEMIRFTNYENYNGDWRVTELIQTDTYENCRRKWGNDNWFLRKIERIALPDDKLTLYKEKYE